MRIARWLPCVAAALLVAACETATSPSSIEELHGAWQLMAINRNDGTDVQPANPASYTAEFTPDGRLHLNADCNVCNGSYTAAASTLETGLMACTRAACPPGSLFDTYVAALARARSFERRGSDLDVVYAEGTLRFTAK